jgi:Tol biopolymer transport system component
MVRLILLLTLLALPLNAYAVDLEEWLDSVVITPSRQKAERKTDNARLLTLEPRETEMYPRVSPNGRFLITVTRRGRDVWLSRRFTENGDPANVVTDDEMAISTFNWKDNNHVYFLSHRAGSPGIWDQAADAEGMVRRLLVVSHNLTQPILLDDGSLIAVRLEPTTVSTRNKPIRKKHRRDMFDNWSNPGFHASIVQIYPGGKTRVLTEGINPALSRDGEWLVFSMSVGRSWHLFRMRLDGSELAQITSQRSIDVQPSWSADGNWIVFTSNRGKGDMRTPSRSNWDIWAIDKNGRNLTRLTWDPARDGGPSVGPDGTVYFHSDRKVSKEARYQHEVKGSTSGFHIWTTHLPQTPVSN